MSLLFLLYLLLLLLLIYFFSSTLYCYFRDLFVGVAVINVAGGYNNKTEFKLTKMTDKEKGRGRMTKSGKMKETRMNYIESTLFYGLLLYIDGNFHPILQPWTTPQLQTNRICFVAVSFWPITPASHPWDTTLTEAEVLHRHVCQFGSLKDETRRNRMEDQFKGTNLNTSNISVIVLKHHSKTLKKSREGGGRWWFISALANLPTPKAKTQQYLKLKSEKKSKQAKW